jgi:SAM-dependent methyltransferase
MFSRVMSYYADQMMRPGFVGLFINPFYFARRELLSAMRDFGPEIRGRVLDVGCGSRPYELLVSSTEYVGLELDTPENRRTKRADVYYDGSELPFPDRSFDGVISNEVLEHVFEPDAFIADIARVLKPNGRLLLTVPFVWDEHEQPRDYGRYSSFGLAALLEKHGFIILRHRKTAANVKIIFQLLNAYLYKITVTRSLFLNLCVTLVLMAPFNLLGALLARITPGNPDLYLDNVVLAERGPSIA